MYFALLLLSLALTTPATASTSCDLAFAAELQQVLDGDSLRDVRIHYSWKRGFGIAEVDLVLRGAKTSILTLGQYEANRFQPSRPKWRERDYLKRVAQQRLRDILQIASDVGFPCMEVRPRDLCAADLGTYTLGIQLPNTARVVSIDGRNYAHSGSERSIDEIFEKIYGLADVFEKRLSWGPVGLYWDECDDEP